MIVVGLAGCGGDSGDGVAVDASASSERAGFLTGAPSACVDATEALIDVTDRSASGDPTANTEAPPGVTVIEIALVDVARRCGQEHVGSALGEWLLWTDGQIARGDERAPALTELIVGLCRDLDQVPPLPERAARECDPYLDG